MEYSHSDAELIKQPIGYWSWAASKAVVARIRGALGELGLTQPQWWVLNQVAHADTPRTRDEVSAVLRGYLDTGQAGLAIEIDGALEHGWITQDADARLELTDKGREFFAVADARQDELREERHAGISDEEYLTTMKVLQRFIHNTGGQAWHH
ncbi:MarR family winged helix-turn-helix transcriptional regulator [Kitasatospora sp. CB01950]|uniref:MarR family winged helix-turn-helix transcriptional regulator n=1 Tax=Kitasatospora sp. CB01950 TaxID=1703930 RepID=UPI00093EB93B|nr:MarR family winged helix-turn-helix transcriptional regulator [Kitasatospora sp. CB01950]OKI93458.1 transcriptional regulator [Kitasatospora sp. CB01950]